MDAKIQKNVQRYIELVYSEKSPLAEIQSLQERKITACKKVGFDHTNEDIKKIIDLQNEKARDMILEYCCKNESPEYMNLLSDAHLFLELQVLKMTPLTPTEDEEKMLKAINLKTAMSSKSEELLARMNASYIKVFKGESEAKEAKKKVSWITFEQRIKQRDEMRKKQDVPQNQQSI